MFLIQFAALLVLYICYALKGSAISINLWALATPVFLAELAILAIGIGIIAASVTVKRRF